MPEWLHILAIASLAAGGLSAIIIALDILAGRPQHMWIMSVVWPITGLYAGPLALYGYFKVGRTPKGGHGGHGHGGHGHGGHAETEQGHGGGEKPQGNPNPSWQSAALAATHCGAGCTLGDICAEWIIFAVPFTLFGHEIFGAWVLDYAFAYAFGIAFQYFTIVPMRGLSFGRGIIAAVKADTLSLTSWQIGMYGWMAIATFAIFGTELHKTDPVFWFMMQIAMVAGFGTACPVNWWLLRWGIKEAM